MSNIEKLRESTEQYVRSALATSGQNPPPDVVQTTVRKVMAEFENLSAQAHDKAKQATS